MAITVWSAILNRQDNGNKVWTEWRSGVVDSSSGAADAGSLPMLGSDGKLDASMLPLIPPANFYSVRVSLDFGRRGPDFYEHDAAVTTITGQPWVTATTRLLCRPVMEATIDHDPDDVWAEEILAYTTNIVPGVGFDVVATCPNGTWGTYLVDVVGA